MRQDVETQKYSLLHFYRIRKFSQSDDLPKAFFTSIQTETDVWAKPAKLNNTFCRLNRIGKSKLYAGSTLLNAIYETNCLPGDKFFLMVYENRRPLRVSQINSVSYIDDLNELENAKLIILHNFLLGEFTKIIPPGREYLYRSTIKIYEEFFHNPLIDAFAYPSTKTIQNIGYNICFEDRKARESLNFLGLMVCEIVRGKADSTDVSIAYYFDGFMNADGTFSFYEGNCDLSRKRFGTFTPIRDAWNIYF